MTKVEIHEGKWCFIVPGVNLESIKVLMSQSEIELYKFEKGLK